MANGENVMMRFVEDAEGVVIGGRRAQDIWRPMRCRTSKLFEVMTGQKFLNFIFNFPPPFTILTEDQRTRNPDNIMANGYKAKPLLSLNSPVPNPHRLTTAPQELHPLWPPRSSQMKVPMILTLTVVKKTPYLH